MGSITTGLEVLQRMGMGVVGSELVARRDGRELRKGGFLESVFAVVGPFSLSAVSFEVSLFCSSLTS